MKAVSLWQPWAAFMAMGWKKNETRSRPIHYRGPLLICAAKRKMDDPDEELVEWAMAETGTRLPLRILYGLALCVVDVSGCVPTEEAAPTRLEHALGNYEPGRFAWVTKNCRPVKPFAVRGYQGLFDVPDERIEWAGTGPDSPCCGARGRLALAGGPGPRAREPQLEFWTDELLPEDLERKLGAFLQAACRVTREDRARMRRFTAGNPDGQVEIPRAILKAFERSRRASRRGTRT